MWGHLSLEWKMRTNMVKKEATRNIQYELSYGIRFLKKNNTLYVQIGFFFCFSEKLTQIKPPQNHTNREIEKFNSKPGKLCDSNREISKKAPLSKISPDKLSIASSGFKLFFTNENHLT